MVQTIKKRDGREVSFDISKITNAIYKAFTATGVLNGYGVAQRLAEQVTARIDEIYSDKVPDVEQIQDVVEQVLIENGYIRTARAYITYRGERTRKREMNTHLMRVFSEITYSDAKDSNIKRENANIDGNSAMGAMLKYGSEGAKQFNEMFVMSPEYSEAHRSGDIHIHDLDFYTLTTTCCQIDIKKLFEGGFPTGHGHLREPQDISSYAALACIAIQSNQNDQHGGQSIYNFDYGMADGVRKTFKKRYKSNIANFLELLTEKNHEEQIEKISAKLLSENKALAIENYADYQKAEAKEFASLGIPQDTIKKAQKYALKKAVSETERATYQAMEALIHNLNTMHSRAGAQIPFSTLNYGMDTSAEGRMVVKNILLATEKGLGNGETPIFPIQIFRVKSGINLNEGEKNHDLFKLACRVSAKRLFPNFSFQDAPFNLKYYKEGCLETEISYMGCRTRVIGNIHDPEREISPGRGNLSFTTINLPRIAIRANKSIAWFFEELDRKIDLVVGQLFERFEIQAKKKCYNFPFLMGAGVWIDSEKLDPESELMEILKHGTLSIGFIGLAEALVALVGSHHGESEKAQNLGLDIVAHMREKLDEISQKTKMNVTLLATPAEGLSGRFVGLDRERFGVIPGVTDREYYTNSFHIPVYYDITCSEKIKLEAPYHALTNAGHITYVELDGDTANNVEVFEKIIKYMHSCGIGYGSINHPVDRDPVCGYTGVIGDKCPKCGRAEGDGPKFSRIRRITGYLVGTIDQFNNAKKAEERERVKHKVNGVFGREGNL